MSKGIQDNRTRVVDVIYTKLGRKYKASSNPSERRKAEITKFSLSDDGVDYNLYDPNLPDAEKALKILNTPQFSAWTDETSLMKNKLKSEPRDFGENYSLDIQPETEVSITIDTDRKAGDRVDTSISITANFPSPSGFKVTINNARYITTRGSDLLVRDRRAGEPVSETRIYRGSTQSGSYSITIPLVYNGDGSNGVRFPWRDLSSFETQFTIESLDEGFSKTIPLKIVTT